jgi:hypothetical protein
MSGEVSELSTNLTNPGVPYSERDLTVRRICTPDTYWDFE